MPMLGGAVCGSGSPHCLHLYSDMEEAQRREAEMTQALEPPLCEERIDGQEKG